MTGIAPSPTEHMTADWFKSSYSGGEGNECVEVAAMPSLVAVRDSKSPHRAALTMSPDVFAVFVESVAQEWQQTR